MPKVFSPRTLEVFEATFTGVPLRQLDRAFASAHIPLGKDPGGPEGARRAQFRRYVASVDQHDPQQLDRLAGALGALIAEVAVSKQDFLVKAAERDGFAFADGTFRPVETTPSSFAVTSLEDAAVIEDRSRRLRLLADESPDDAVGGAAELVESVCRTVLRLVGEPAPKAAGLAAVVASTVSARAFAPEEGARAKKGADPVRRCLEQLGAVVVDLTGVRKGLSPRHARLAVGAAVTLAAFVTETYLQRGGAKPG